MEKKYVYYFDRWKKQYDSEEELREAFKSKVCKPEKHDWKTSFLFGVWKCNTCGAFKEVIA